MRRIAIQEQLEGGPARDGKGRRRTISGLNQVSRAGAFAGSVSVMAASTWVNVAAAGSAASPPARCHHSSTYGVVIM